MNAGRSVLIDEQGEKTALLLDLKGWGELWEDFYDVIVSQSRKEEPTVRGEDLENETRTLLDDK